MKQIFRTAFMIAGLCTAVPLNAAEDNGARDIRGLLDAQVAAWNRGDLISFMQGYWKSPNTEFVSAGGVLRGWQNVLARYRKAYPERAAMGKLTFSDLEINVVCPHAAHILGHWELQREHDRLRGVFTLLARRFPEGWRIVNDHTSKLENR